MAVAWAIWPSHVASQVALGVNLSHTQYPHSSKKAVHRGNTKREPYYPRVPNKYPTIWFLPSNIHTSLMSPTAASSTATRFQPILDAAFDSYANQTGIDLVKHPSADKLQNCHSLEDVLQLLLERERAFKDYRERHHKLIDSLRPVVKIVHQFSNFFGEVAGVVSFGQRIHLLFQIFTVPNRHHSNRQRRYLLASTFSSQYVSISICPIRILA